jgi:hypothetical protein
MAKANVKSTMQLLDEFLGSFKKEAFEAGTEQKTLGTEQVEAANDSGSTVSEEKPLDTKDKDALDTPNAISPVRMAIDESVQEKSEVVDTVAKETVSENIVEKTARATRLGNAILTAIDGILSKEAAAAKVTPEQALFNKIAAESMAAANDYYQSHLMGRLQRLNDEAELAKANIPKNVLQKVGGIKGLLDKVAMEDPNAVLPVGEAMAVDGAPMDQAGEIAPEELDALAAELEAQGVTPEELEAALAGGGEAAPMDAEAPEVAATGEEIDPAALDQLADELDQAGVTPEDLVSAFEDIKALQEAGVQPDELAAAVEEMVASESGDQDAAPVAEEAAVEEVAVPAEEEGIEAEASVQKEAGAARARIDAIKKYLMA